MVSVPDAAWTYDELETDGLDLREPLRESAGLMSSVAAGLCRGNHVDPRGCGWYHGTWQFLRLMDLVSTPTWHHDFYQASLRAAVAAGARRFLITGTADYSVLAYVIDALGERHPEATITVVDLCETPLYACRWYARRAGVEITTVAEDVLAYTARSPGSADVVVTDAFLTRFGAAGARQVVAGWATALVPGGRAITTVRTYGDGSPSELEQEQAICGFRNRALESWRRWEAEQLRSGVDIGHQAERYARRMVSTPLGDAGEIMRLLGSALSVERAELAAVPGELFPSRYLRMNLSADR